jgi:hypothetical protein
MKFQKYLTFLKVIFVWIEIEGSTDLACVGNDVKNIHNFMGAILDLLRTKILSTAQECNGVYDDCWEMLIHDVTAFQEDWYFPLGPT